MSDSFSIERRKLMRALGAKVILCPAAERATGMIKRAEDYAKKNNAFLARQFENEANPAYHRSTTGPEILQDFAGRRLDWFVTGWGTGGTLTGAGEMIKLARPDVKIVATEPEGAAMLSGKDWQPHKIQGWTPNLIPAVLNKKVADEIIPVSDIYARDTARALSQKEGICGTPPAERCRRARARGKGRPRFRAARDAARYRRALPLDRAVRGHRRDRIGLANHVVVVWRPCGNVTSRVGREALIAVERLKCTPIVVRSATISTSSGAMPSSLSPLASRHRRRGFQAALHDLLRSA
jgi:hypothetical protein